ncbi:MAG: magnesium transporter [Gammaproteobacteria bacterium]|nr:magnesium transporter [Gammaproteobacteria bacterium]MCP5200660.1 magnesium transporter [Gammaproteobacteria bacterium]
MAEQISRTQEFVQAVQDALEANEIRRVREFLAELHPSEIADLLESLPGPVRSELWVHIDSAIEGDVLSHASTAVRNSLLEDMAPEQVAQATSQLDSDDVADILQDLPEDLADEVLLSMDEQNRQRIAAVLTFPYDTAGGLMNPDAVTVRGDISVEVVLRYLRRMVRMPDNTDQLFVVDRGNVYLGILRLTSLVLASPDARVEEVMSSDERPIVADTPVSEVVLLFEQRDLVSAPVVDEAGHLLGRITIDDVVDVIREESDRSLMSAAGLDEEHDIFAPLLVTARQRALWLAINLGTAFLAAWVIGLFEATIDKLVALAVLMPVVASMGGIAGSQTLTIVVRGLALGQVGPANARSVLWREVAVGVINGTVWAVVVAVIAAAWFNDVRLGVVIGCAMVLNLFTAGLAGASIPLALRWMNIDPALAGGVVLTTVTDVVGFFAFLGLASQFLV